MPGTGVGVSHPGTYFTNIPDGGSTSAKHAIFDPLRSFYSFKLQTDPTKRSCPLDFSMPLPKSGPRAHLRRLQADCFNAMLQVPSAGAFDLTKVTEVSGQSITLSGISNNDC